MKFSTLFFLFFLPLAVAGTTNIVGNQTVFLNPNETIYLNSSNTTVIANYTIGANILLKYSACIGVIDPARSFCDAVPNNQPLTSYFNNLYNFSCQAPAFPVINLNKTLVSGEVYNNPDYNLKLECLSNITIPLLNISKNLIDNNVYRNDDLNLTVSCSASVAPVNATTCSTIVNDEVNRIVNERLDAIANQSQNPYLLANLSKQFCYTLPNAANTSCASTIVLNGTSICVDSISQICSLQEITGDLKGCFLRFVKDQTQQSENLKTSNDALNKQLSDANDRIRVLSDSSNIGIDLMKAFARFIGILVFAYTCYHFTRNKPTFKTESETKEVDKK